MSFIDLSKVFNAIVDPTTQRAQANRFTYFQCVTALIG